MRWWIGTHLKEKKQTEPKREIRKKVKQELEINLEQRNKEKKKVIRNEREKEELKKMKSLTHQQPRSNIKQGNRELEIETKLKTDISGTFMMPLNWVAECKYLTKVHEEKKQRKAKKEGFYFALLVFLSGFEFLPHPTDTCIFH